MTSRRRLAAASSVAVLAALANAQTWGVTVVAPVPGTATASVTSNYAPPVTVLANVPVGPVSEGEFLSAYAQAPSSGSARTTASWHDTFPGLVGRVGFEVDVAGLALINSPFGMTHTVASCSSAATLRMVLQAPVPAAGRLLIDFHGYAHDIGDAEVDVDIGDDGTVDLHADSGDFPWSAPWATQDWSVQIGAAGLPIRLHLTTATGMGVWGAQWVAHGVGMTVRCQFLPGQPRVTTFATTGASAILAHTHSPANVVTLFFATPSLALPGVFVFGTQPLVATIPGLPTVTQLVSVDAIAVASQLALPVPSLPPGTALYCQGLVVDSGGTLRSTKSLRALWP